MSIIIRKLIIIVTCIGMLTIMGCAAHQIQSEQALKAAGYNALLGAEYLRKDRLNLANDKLKQALKQNPQSVDANHYYALLQQRLKQNKLAEKHFKIALNVKPNSELRNNYGSFLCKQKRFSEADKQFSFVLSDPLYRTPEYVNANAGVCAMNQGKIAKAKQYFITALEKRPNFPSALLELAQLYSLIGDYSRAQAYLFRYNEQAVDSKRSLTICQAIHKKLGELDKAEECTSKLLNYR